MSEDLIQTLVDQGGVIVLSALILWRIDAKLERLIQRIDKLADAVTRSVRQ